MSSNEIEKLTIGSLLNGQWKVEEEIGTGGYGTVYKAFDLFNDHYVAVKMELHRTDVSKCRLTREVKVYKKMKGNGHFPLLYCEKEIDDKHFIVIELLGPSVDTLLKQYKIFRLHTVATIGYQCVETIRDLHNKGIVHCDIKTSNFAIGVGAKRSTIYMYDFGLCRRFCDSTGRIYPTRKRPQFRGTLTYASVNVQSGHDVSRGDDLRSLFYMIYELLKGTLPWSLETTSTGILRSKIKNDIENMTTDLPVPINQMGHLVFKIRFDETPDYNALLNMFRAAMIQQGITGRWLGAMPKKWAGENSKAAAARARKEEARKAELERKEKERLDNYWKEDDKLIVRKMERRDDRERKRLEELQRKQASRAQLEKEMEELNMQNKKKQEKLTRSEIMANRVRMNREAEKQRPRPAAPVVIAEESIPENVNRLETLDEEARTVEKAISILSNGSDVAVDRHPERRARTAFAAFQETRLPELKKEHPNLRLSQLNQMLKKEWQKSPDNPLNYLA
ncbi:hypothetical protein D918_07944 [Trichuris suis]|nr:hypothetical protein D918_07944 [Trichuris suis]